MIGRFIGQFLDNESSFGRLMTKCGIIIGANLMFVIFSLPLITMGPALVALYHVMLKTLRGDGVLNPFGQFWAGFKSNFKQSMIYWAVFLVIAVIGIIDLKFCGQFESGTMKFFKYALLVVALVIVAITIYMMPVMAAFSDTIPHLIRNALFFISKNPIRMIIILFFNVFPLYLTYTDVQFQPLYAFIWAFFGFGAVAMLTSTLLLKDFSLYLPKVDSYGNILTEEEIEELRRTGKLENYEEQKDTEKEILDDMKKIGM
ncbi:MAG: DUF624 domain-containing protein [Blautia sp.]|nr:DUF624 domain-containing protein [Blautia sp.]